jgi:tetratricopeptide (TPR) repeat protein
MQRRLVADHSSDASFASQLAESVANLGMLEDGQGHQEAAERALVESVALLRPAAADTSSDPRYSRNLAIASNNLSYVLAKRDPAAAERAAHEAIEILEGVAKGATDGGRYQDDLALCYNNLAALESRAGKPSEAIEWYGRAVSLQEQMVRKAPGVVRSRSELAVTFNNLGVALCGAGRTDEAASPFARSRELMATLASDYPDELSYQTSLAALLNNQALALAGAGQHEESVAIYHKAIEVQWAVWKRSPHSNLMQELLSKMYYNEGQSLLALGDLDAAYDVAQSRRGIWKNNGPRLVGVAAEMAAIGRAARALPSRPDDSRVDVERILTLDGQAIEILRESIEHDGPKGADLAKDERFAYLLGNEDFAKLISGTEQDQSKGDGKSSAKSPD